MKLQEFKKVDPKNYDYYDLCYRVYRFLKRPELYQVIKKFDGKAYTKRFETALQKCANDLSEKGCINALDLAIISDNFNNECWLVTFKAEIFLWVPGHYSQKIRFSMLSNDKKLNAENTILKDNAILNINNYKKSLRKQLLRFIKTVRHYEKIKMEIEQKQKEFESWRAHINDQYSYYVLYEMGLKSLI